MCWGCKFPFQGPRYRYWAVSFSQWFCRLQRVAVLCGWPQTCEVLATLNVFAQEDGVKVEGPFQGWTLRWWSCKVQSRLALPHAREEVRQLWCSCLHCRRWIQGAQASCLSSTSRFLQRATSTLLIWTTWRWTLRSLETLDAWKRDRLSWLRGLGRHDVVGHSVFVSTSGLQSSSNMILLRLWCPLRLQSENHCFWPVRRSIFRIFLGVGTPWSRLQPVSLVFSEVASCVCHNDSLSVSRSWSVRDVQRCRRLQGKRCDGTSCQDPNTMHGRFITILMRGLLRTGQTSSGTSHGNHFLGALEWALDRVCPLLAR